jgi:glycerophosphoryl diester phosphodiesterase
MIAELQRPTTVQQFMRLGARVRIIAHRGFSGRAPENTLAAVRLAIDEGADMVELDFQPSSDGEIVCFHDDTLDRTTDGTGLVSQTPLDMLKRLDAGSWFSPRFRDERIPTLSELLDEVDGRILLNIEIKGPAISRSLEGSVATRVAEIVADHGMREQVVVSSFSRLVLDQMRSADPRIITASLFDDTLPDDAIPSELVAEVGSRGLNVDRKRVDVELVERCVDSGIPLAVYTVDRPKEMKRLVEMGVHAIFTNRPDRLKEVLRELRVESDYPPVEDIAGQPDRGPPGS